MEEERLKKKHWKWKVLDLSSFPIPSAADISSQKAKWQGTYHFFSPYPALFGRSCVTLISKNFTRKTTTMNPSGQQIFSYCASLPVVTLEIVNILNTSGWLDSPKELTSFSGKRETERERERNRKDTIKKNKLDSPYLYSVPLPASWRGHPGGGHSPVNDQVPAGFDLPVPRGPESQNQRFWSLSTGQKGSWQSLRAALGRRSRLRVSSLPQLRGSASPGTRAGSPFGTHDLGNETRGHGFRHRHHGLSEVSFLVTSGKVV